MTDKSDTELPAGLMPLSSHDKKRALDIVEAMHRYVIADKPIPNEWFAELSDLKGVA